MSYSFNTILDRMEYFSQKAVTFVFEVEIFELTYIISLTYLLEATQTFLQWILISLDYSPIICKEQHI